MFIGTSNSILFARQLSIAQTALPKCQRCNTTEIRQFRFFSTPADWIWLIPINLCHNAARRVKLSASASYFRKRAVAKGHNSPEVDTEYLV